MVSPKHLAKLTNNGVRGWNQWRRENPDIIPNLRKADLSEIDLRFVDFRGADLSEAKLISACLCSAKLDMANLSKANLNKANLRFAQLYSSNLHRANLAKANLSEVSLGKACLSEANLNRTILYAANLSFADFRKANLSQADLSLATLKETNLQDSDLSSTQMLGTNFRGANLTGACLQNWNLNSKTDLFNVQCDYVYLKKELGFNFISRLPRTGTFQDGEFSQKFQKISSSTEIIFGNGMPDFFESFRELQQHYSDKLLVIQKIEPRNKDVFVACLEVVPEANKAISEKFYEEQQHLIEATYRLLQENVHVLNQQNYVALEAIKSLAERPISINVEATAMSNSEGFTNNLQGANIANFANQVRDSAQQQSNQYNNSTIEKTLVDAAREIQALLDHLSQSYSTHDMAEKYAFANETIRRINNDPCLSQRILGALKAGSTSALEQFLNHPAASFVISALEDWQRTRVL